MKCGKLDVWKQSSRLSVKIYRYFTSCKDFGFKNQIARRSLSVSSNIAEEPMTELITRIYIVWKWDI